MKVALTVSAFVAALAVAPLASADAAPVVRPFSPPVFHPWRDGADHDAWRHRHHDFIGAVGPIVDETPDSSLESTPTPAPFVVAAPVFVDVTLAPAAGSQPGWTAGPKLIEIGRAAPRHEHLPLVIYGD